MDEADVANDRAQMDTDSALRAQRMRAAEIPVGAPGECYLCGEHSQRLVRGVCAPCRDKYRLP